MEVQLRVLGAHNYESRETRYFSYLVDGVLALDVGSLTRALTFDQQRQVRAVILSGRHFDHTRDLVPLGMYARSAGFTVDVYGIDDTIEFVTTNLLDTRNSPDLTRVPTPEHPAYRFHTADCARSLTCSATRYSLSLCSARCPPLACRSSAPTPGSSTEGTPAPA